MAAVPACSPLSSSSSSSASHNDFSEIFLTLRCVSLCGGGIRLLVSEVWTFWTFTAVGGTGGPSGLAKSDCLGSNDEEGVTEGSVVQGNWVGGRAGVDGLAHSPWVGGAVCGGGGSDVQGNWVGGRAGIGGLVLGKRRQGIQAC